MFSPYGNPYQQPARRGLAGRTVATLAEVTPADVPVDGGTAWFPAADGSMVWAKSWAPDGTVRTTAYEPAERPAAEAGGWEKAIGDVTARIEALEAKAKRRKEAHADD